MTIRVLRRGTIAASVPTTAPSTPPAFRDGSSNYVGTTVTNLPLTIPGTVQDGDLMLAFWFGNPQGAWTFGTPSGWTLVRQYLDVAGFRRFKQSGDTTVTSTLSGGFADQPICGILVAYSGVNATTPVDGYADVGWDTPITTTVANTMIVQAFGSRTSGGGTVTLTSRPATDRFAITGITDLGMAMSLSDHTEAAAGSASVPVPTKNTGFARGLTVALRPA